MVSARTFHGKTSLCGQWLKLEGIVETRYGAGTYGDGFICCYDENYIDHSGMDGVMTALQSGINGLANSAATMLYYAWPHECSPVELVCNGIAGLAEYKPIMAQVQPACASLASYIGYPTCATSGQIGKNTWNSESPPCCPGLSNAWYRKECK
ncbi:hypothetical protein HON15_00815 [Candidatus Woesearchaeota archaeon]|nr:hypothetical protein [Candidatus Woesearchaeota archaeon]